jgi:nucleoside 2-deoxyribosyltransferase
MAKIYVASNEVVRAKKVMAELVAAGHTITFDWTIDIEKGNEQDKINKPLREREAIRECDVLIYLWKENQESARFEAGMAMGLGKKIIAVTDHQAWFFALPEVIQVSSDDQVLSALGV